MNPLFDFRKHWNKAYLSKDVKSLGWYEDDVSATLNLIDKTRVSEEASILNVGAGSTTLVDKLLQKGFTNIIASDLSEVSLNSLKKRLGDNSSKVEWVVDDLTQSTKLYDLEPIDLWIDRAVLHFFMEEKDRNKYFELLQKLIKPNGFAIFAEFSLSGASKCSGLDVYRYSNNILLDCLGNSFELIDTFDYTYKMPSGDSRPYIYSLFKRRT